MPGEAKALLVLFFYCYPSLFKNYNTLKYFVF